MTGRTDNTQCVRAERDPEGRWFMDVTCPKYVCLSISDNGTIWVNVNDSCVFRLCKPELMTVENNFDEKLFEEILKKHLKEMKEQCKTKK